MVSYAPLDLCENLLRLKTQIRDGTRAIDPTFVLGSERIACIHVCIFIHRYLGRYIKHLQLQDGTHVRRQDPPLGR